MKSAAAHPPIESLFRALSDRTRLRILALLKGGELCVCDLVEVLDIPQPTASRHLAYLRKSRLVLTRKQGHWIYYRLAPISSGGPKKLLESVMACAAEIPEAVSDAKRLAARACGPACCD